MKRKNVTIKDLAILLPEDISYGILRYGDYFNQKIKFYDVSEIATQYANMPIIAFDFGVDKNGKRYFWART